MDIYSRELLHNFREQPYKKDIKHFDRKGNAVNASCGDDIEIKLKVENGVIKDVGYKTGGCIVSQGSMSVLSKNILGMKVEDVAKLTDSDYLSLIGIELTPARQNCALVGLKALKNAIK
jgi:NifU-like protein involved in Fe-S cluster formation